MKKKVILTLGVVALAASAYAGFRCNFCGGTGFQKGTNSQNLPPIAPNDRLR